MTSQSKINFSIIIPSYNSEDYIGNALRSISETCYDKNKIEVVVIDDGSKNDLCKEICKSFKDLNILYIKKPNGNWGSVINYVRQNQLVHGLMVSILDSDDFYDEKVFECVEKYINTNDVIVGNYKLFDGKKIGHKVYTHLSLFTHDITNHFSKISPYCLPLPYFFSKEIFYETKDLTEKISFQDGDVNSQIIQKSKKLKYVNKTLGYYYFNRDGNSMSDVWNDARFNSILNVCHKFIENNAQEQVVYRMMANRQLRNKLETMRKNGFTFSVTRKFKFRWIPIIIRWIFLLIFSIRFSRYFTLVE